MSYRDQRLGSQLLGVANCPHCGVASPLLALVWHSGQPVSRADGGIRSLWSAFTCTTCGSVVSARGQPGNTSANPPVVQIYPDDWEANTVLPTSVAKFLEQAHKTKASPDASALMSASAVDAMLKDKGLIEGSLYVRIEKAVTNGLLTAVLATWAHRVRLDANNPRHADDKNPHLNPDEAIRAFEFATALSEYLYVLPSRMPAEEKKAE